MMKHLILFSLLLLNSVCFAINEINIDEDTYIFTLEEINRFEELEDEFNDNKCLTGPPQDSCKCNMNVLSAKIKALSGNVHIYPNDPIGIKVKEQSKKLDAFSKAGRYQINRTIGGQSCLPFGSYQNVSCQPKNKNGEEKYQTCSCYEKWIKTNITSLTKSINFNLKKLRERSADDVFMDSLISSSLSTLRDCAPLVNDPLPKSDCDENPKLKSSTVTKSTPRVKIKRDESTTEALNRAKRIKNKSLQQILCEGNDEEELAAKTDLLNFISQDSKLPIYNNSPLKKETAKLGDHLYCLLPANKMHLAKTKIVNFSNKFGSVANLQFACRFAGLSMSTYCHSPNNLRNDFQMRIQNNCSPTASGFIQIPPYGVGTPSPYQSAGGNGQKATTGIEIKNTPACNFLLEKCHEFSKKINFNQADQINLQNSITKDFLIPFENLSFEGVPAAEACHGSKPSFLTEKLEEVQENILMTDIKGNLTSLSTKTIGLALYANPLLKKIFDNGGEEILSLLISSVIELRASLTSIEISPFGREKSAKRRSQEEMEKLYKKEYDRRLIKSSTDIVEDTIQTACESVKGPKKYVKFFQKAAEKTPDIFEPEICPTLIKEFGIDEMVQSAVAKLFAQ